LAIVAELEHVAKVYGSGEAAVSALNDLCMQVRKGEYLAVMGTSGSGKSTAMNILGCLDRPSSGSYRLNGQPVEHLSDDALADLRLLGLLGGVGLVRRRRRVRGRQRLRVVQPHVT